MHTVELLEQAREAAERLGFKLREDWLGGNGGGACEFAGQKWIFIDLALNAVEQLEQVSDALRSDPGIYLLDLSLPLRKLLDIRQAA
jgi:hypothetical protein